MCVREEPDDGFILTGAITTYKPTGNPDVFKKEHFLMRTDPSGFAQWCQRFAPECEREEGTMSGELQAVLRTADGGYALLAGKEYCVGAGAVIVSFWETRLIKTDEDAYLGAGIGYQNVDYGDAGAFDGSTSGFRISFEGQVSFFYGKFAWMPSLSGFDSGSLSFSNVSGTEWEVGAFYPFGRFRAFVAYRTALVQLTASAGGEQDANADTETGGFLLGLGIDF